MPLADDLHALGGVLALLLGLRGELLLGGERLLDLGLDRHDVDADAVLDDPSDGLGQARFQRQRVGADLARLERQPAAGERHAQLAAVLDRDRPQVLLGVAVVAHRRAVAGLEAARVDGRDDLDGPRLERAHLELRDRARGDRGVRARQRDELERPDAGRRAVVARRRDVDPQLQLGVAAARPERHEERGRGRDDRPALRQPEHGEVVVVDDLALVADRGAERDRRAGVDARHAAEAGDRVGRLQDDRGVAARSGDLGRRRRRRRWLGPAAVAASSGGRGATGGVAATCVCAARRPLVRRSAGMRGVGSGAALAGRAVGRGRIVRFGRLARLRGRAGLGGGGVAGRPGAASPGWAGAAGSPGWAGAAGSPGCPGAGVTGPAGCAPPGSTGAIRAVSSSAAGAAAASLSAVANSSYSSSSGSPPGGAVAAAPPSPVAGVAGALVGSARARLVVLHRRFRDRGDHRRRGPREILAAALAEVAAGRVLEAAAAAASRLAHGSSPSSSRSPGGSENGGRSSGGVIPRPVSKEDAAGTSGSVLTSRPRRTRSL